MPTQRILILSFYYAPDLCAGSFRTTAFVNALKNQVSSDVGIEVLTTMPNRYHSYDSDAAEIEEFDNVVVRRFALKAHRSGFVDQSLCFSSFARQVLKHVAAKKYDLVFATSSRLMTAALGAKIANQKKIPLYLDIRDIFTDTMSDVLSKSASMATLPLFKLIERRTIKSAKTINLVSQGFADYFNNYDLKEPLRFFTNGIDPEFLGPDYTKRNNGDGRRTILVAGNIGEGQGLHKLIPKAADLLRDQFELVVIGDGGMKDALVEACLGKSNVQIIDPVNRKALIGYYANADILLMHLNDYAAFRKVLPSKVFEYAATGKPILAGVSGFAAEFTERNVENAVVFPPCDADKMVNSLGELDLSLNDRTSFNEKYSRERIMDEFAGDVVSTVMSDARRT